VITTAVGSSVSQTGHLHRPTVIGRQLQPLDVHGKVLAALPQFFSQPHRSFSQKIAKTFPVADQGYQVDNQLGIAKINLSSTGILISQNPFFIALHGKSDGTTG